MLDISKLIKHVGSIPDLVDDQGQEIELNQDDISIPRISLITIPLIDPFCHVILHFQSLNLKGK